MKCPKCEGEMEEGIIADRLPAGSTKSQWGKKLKLGGFGGVEDSHDVIAYRCKKCGYLENYAK